MQKPQPELPDWFLTERRSYYCRKRKREIEIDAWVCDARFRALRDELVGEVQRYWKRLRKSGHQFSYLVVFEQHKSGDPHIHFLLHEQDGRIRKKDLERQWSLGFTKCVLIGGRSRQEARADQAAWYVAKYLSKSPQARQIASRNYVPEGRL